MMIKATPSKATVLRINIVFWGFFLIIIIVYATLLFSNLPSIVYDQENDASTLLTCSMDKCNPKVQNEIRRKVVVDEQSEENGSKIRRRMAAKRVEKPINFLNGIVNDLRMKISDRELKVGIVSIDNNENLMSEWNILPRERIFMKYEKVSRNLKWEHIFPEWIDEEEEKGAPSCPKVPMPQVKDYPYLDLIVAKLPSCTNDTISDNESDYCSMRDVFRLQIHLIVAKLAAFRGRRDWFEKTKVVFYSKYRPMVELFRCNELKKHEGDFWYFEPHVTKLAQKVSLPIGSCNLALPLFGKDIKEVYDVSELESSTTNPPKKEAYATVLHSSQVYVCGAIALAQSLLKTGTKRDLILLLDKSIPKAKQDALIKSGWALKFITRIRNPRSEKGSYNEYNYSKLRLWQLTEYDKIVFVDSDVVVLRNLDVLFRFPELSAAGNDGSIFNSGVMVIEPSDCTFDLFIKRLNDVVSYNGGDQGFLNEMFVWWHRLPRRMNFLKNFWSNSTTETRVKNRLFGSDPPELYAIHYLGVKPWLCYRDYDCNWDISDQRVYASDVAHRKWWKIYDQIDATLHEFCGLPGWRRVGLEKYRKKAKKMKFQDQHWKINITDPRRFN